jgi:hypothetical protein
MTKPLIDVYGTDAPAGATFAKGDGRDQRNDSGQGKPQPRAIYGQARTGAVRSQVGSILLPCSVRVCFLDDIGSLCLIFERLARPGRFRYRAEMSSPTKKPTTRSFSVTHALCTRHTKVLPVRLSSLSYPPAASARQKNRALVG